MPKFLYLVRHGEATPPDLDHNQPLTVRGLDQTRGVANVLRGLDGQVDEILHSTKLRAKQTAEILRNTIAPDVALIEKEGLRPMDPIEPLVFEIDAYDRNVMIVGHLPFMENLSSQLLLGMQRGGFIEWHNSCVVCLAAENGAWTLQWIVNPELSVVQKTR